MMTTILLTLAFSNGPEVAGDTYFPIGKGHKWVYKTDYDDETDIIHEVTGSEKVDDVECFVLETRSENATEKRIRTIRKEWLAASEDGVKIHKILRGRSEMDVEKPILKLKSDLRKDVEWEGEAKASENPAKHHYRVDGEEAVEVPAGKFKAIKVAIKIESGDRHVAEGFEWYAKNVGLVKSEMTIKFRGEGPTIVSELKEFKAGK